MLLNIFIELVIAIMMAFLISYIVFLYNKKQIALKLDFEKELRTAMLEIQEQTSLHISRELHDNVNGYLSLAKLNLNTSMPFLDDKTKPKAEDTLYLLDHSLEAIRSISRSLSPDHMAFDSIVSMLDDYLGWIKKSGNYEVNFTITGERYNIKKDTEIMLFRILQEIISNILKHAKASKITISLTYEADTLKCIVSDNGVGFDVKEKLNGGSVTRSLGLQNLIRRAKMINAVCDINSDKQTGTTICITTILS